MIVIFEGLDNCGKTTLVGKLHNYYESKGVKSEVSKEFGANIGKEIKAMAEAGTLDPILKGYLFAADRYIRMRDITKEDMGSKILLFDRYVPSAMAYRMAEGVDKDWVANINSVFPKPDIGFFIDITPEESVRRNTDAKFNIKASAEYLAKVREAYISILKENNLFPINGMQPIETIFEEVIDILEDYRANKDKRKKVEHDPEL